MSNKPTYDHAYTIAFSVKTTNNEEEVTVEEYKAALMQRIADLENHNEWVGVLDFPYDSYVIEENVQ